MTAIDYCAVSDVEAYLGTEFTATTVPTTTQVETLITNASRLVDTYAGTQVAGTQSFTEYHNVNIGMQTLVLKNRPVVSITSVQEVGHDGTTLTTLDAGRARDGTDDYWLKNADAGIIKFHASYMREEQDFLYITYTAGRAAPTHEAKMATILIAARHAARAKILDENCTERVKEVTERALRAIEGELDHVLRKVKDDFMVNVGVLG